MSNRRETAAAATKSARASRKAPTNEYRPGSGAVTRAEREAVADGIRAGAKQRLRLLARDIVGTCTALRNDGREVTEAMFSFRCPTCEASGADCRTCENTGEVDARDVLADAAAAARPGRGFGTGWKTADDQTGAPNGARLTGADVMALASYGATCAGRMARPSLGSEEWTDVRSYVAEAILKRGAYGLAPRWRSLRPADYTGAPIKVEALRDQWKGLAYMAGRRWILDVRAPQLAAEVPADFSDPGEDAPTTEQAAANASEIATAVLMEAMAETEPDVTWLDRVHRVKPTERDALSIGYAGNKRADLAAARSVEATAVKMSANRGRKALDARFNLPACPPNKITPERIEAERIAAPDVKRWAREAARRKAAASGPADPLAEVTRVQAGDVHPYRGVRLSWPDRQPDYSDGADTHLPAPITGAGTRSNLPAVGRDVEAIGYRPRGRRTAPVSCRPCHAFLAPLAATARVLAAMELPAPFIGPLPLASMPAAPAPVARPVPDGVITEAAYAMRQASRRSARIAKQEPLPALPNPAPEAKDLAPEHARPAAHHWRADNARMTAFLMAMTEERAAEADRRADAPRKPLAPIRPRQRKIGLDYRPRLTWAGETARQLAERDARAAASADASGAPLAA
jgi:hypothetical protein